MREHLNADRLAFGACNWFRFYRLMYGVYLLHVEFSGKYHYVGELGIEAQGFCIGYIKLCREVYLYSYFACIGHSCNIGGNDCRYAGCRCIVNELPHIGHVSIINDGIDG